MFAYCNNNPVSYSDPSGELTRGQIHDAVLDEIVARMSATGRTTLSRHKTCIYKNGKDFLGGWGFCDLYDTRTGEVWELKRITCNEKKACKQLNNYTKGRLKDNLGLQLSVGGTLLPEGRTTFVKTDSSGTYSIQYWQGNNGILWYDYTYKKSNSQKIIDNLAMGGLVLSATLLATSFGAGAGVAAATPIILEYLSNAA